MDKTFPFRPGDILRNGARVIECRPRDNDTFLVVALTGSEPHPYAVWTARHDAPEATFWGHYFGSLADAVYYTRRISRGLSRSQTLARDA